MKSTTGVRDASKEQPMFAVGVEFANLLVAALVAGAMFGVWLSFNPAGLDATSYVALQQQAIRTLNTTMPALGGGGGPANASRGRDVAGRPSAPFAPVGRSRLFCRGGVDHPVLEPAHQRDRDWLVSRGTARRLDGLPRRLVALARVADWNWNSGIVPRDRGVSEGRRRRRPHKIVRFVHMRDSAMRAPALTPSL